MFLSVESVTESFPLAEFCFAGQFLKHSCFSSPRLIVRSVCRTLFFFLPQFHNRVLVPPGLLDDGFLSRLGCVSGFPSFQL